MKLVARFFLDNNIYFEIQVPGSKEKINYFYPASEILHQFDEGTITYYFNNADVILQIDTLQGILTNFASYLNKSINNEKNLPNSICIGTLGYHFNERNFQETRLGYKYDDIFPKFWIFSGIEIPRYPKCEIQTWIYNVDGMIYIEISPSYKWLFGPLTDEFDDFALYKEFMQSYKLIALLKITKEQAQEWLSICEKLIKDLDIYY